MRGQDRSGLKRFRMPLAGACSAACWCSPSARSRQTRRQIVPRVTGGAQPMGDVPAPPLARPITDDKRMMRNYPEQPPIIPHSIDGYQLTLKTNRCLDCHRRQYTEGSGAPMISVTHFMDRDSQVLADVTPRRYFCTACHVPQTDAQPLVPNTFEDMLLVEPERSEQPAMQRLKALLIWFWQHRQPPQRPSQPGFLTLGGFVCGVLFWGAFNTALEVTNTEKFCTSCHEMRDNVYQELQRTPHFSNRSGVRATCPDCHVPHEWTDKIARKMQASKEVWGKIFGTIDTRQKFQDHRLELAKHEWARMKANDSLECRNCHSSVGDGLHQANAARRRNPRQVSRHRREDLHRLPQGHRSRTAGHDRHRTGLAGAARNEGASESI